MLWKLAGLSHQWATLLKANDLVTDNGDCVWLV